MSDTAILTDEQRQSHNRLLWLTAAILGAIFFYKNHSLTVSQYEMWVPWTDGENFKTAGGNVLKGLALSLTAVLGGFLLVRKEGQRLRLGSPLGVLIIVYFLWCGTSVLWSIDRGATVRHMAVFTFCFIAAIGIARQFRPRDIVLMTVIVYSGYFLIGVVCEFGLGTFRPWAAGYRFAGTLHPNAQGANLGLLCVAAFTLSRTVEARHRRRLLALVAVAFLFLLLTKSRTSAAACLAAGCAVWCLDVSPRARVVSGVGTAWIAGFAALLALILGYDVINDVTEAAMLGRGEESMALTGRIPIWTELMRYVWERPLAGYGYEAFWTEWHIEDLSEQLHWVFREAHSTYVETLLGVGIVGAILLSMTVLTALWVAAVRHRQTGDPACAFVFGFIVFLMTTGVMESGSVIASFETTMAGSAMAMLAFRRDILATSAEQLTTREKWDPPAHRLTVAGEPSMPG